MHNSLTDFSLPDTSVIYGEKDSLNHNKDESFGGCSLSAPIVPDWWKDMESKGHYSYCQNNSSMFKFDLGENKLHSFHQPGIWQEFCSVIVPFKKERMKKITPSDCMHLSWQNISIHLFKGCEPEKLWW